MNKFLDILRAFIGTQDEKVVAKNHFLGLHTSDENWHAARDAFRALDDRCEELAAELVTAINECRTGDQLEDALAALTAAEERALRLFLDSRGMAELLNVEPKGLGELITKYRRAGFIFTAVQALNRMRGSCDDVAQWEAILDGEAPRENLEEGWDKAVEMIQAAFDALVETADAEPEEIWREVAYELERKTRKALDVAGERLVDYMRNLVESGRFDFEVSELEPELRRHARDLLRMVPQVQAVPQTRPEPRTVTVLDRPETDTEPDLDTDAQEVLN